MSADLTPHTFSPMAGGLARCGECLGLERNDFCKADGRAALIGAPNMTALQAQLVDELAGDFRKALGRNPDRGELMEAIADRERLLEMNGHREVAAAYGELFELYRIAPALAGAFAADQATDEQALEAFLADISEPLTTATCNACGLRRPADPSGFCRSCLEADDPLEALARGLTVDDLEAGLDHPDYAGFGYLGERARCGRIGRMQTVDAAILERANELGWDAHQLAAWTTSKAGRWFADETLGSGAELLQLRELAVAAAARYMTQDQPR